MTGSVSASCRSAPITILVAIPRPWDDPGVREVLVWPGTTPRCVVEQLGLPGRVLVRFGRDVAVLPEDDPLLDSPCVFAGARLFAL